MTYILVVDDDPTVRALLQETLEEEGYAVTTAADGALAATAVATAHPDAILVDVMLPALDGLSLCHQLHADPATRAIPLVLCSALDEAQLPPGCPYWAFIPKPFQLDQVARTVQQVLAVR